MSKLESLEAHNSHSLLSIEVILSVQSRPFWTAGNCTILLSLWGFSVIPQVWVLSAASSVFCEMQAPVLCLSLQSVAARALQKQFQLLPRERTIWIGGSDPLTCFLKAQNTQTEKKSQTNGCSPWHPEIPWIQFVIQHK